MGKVTNKRNRKSLLKRFLLLFLILFIGIGGFASYLAYSAFKAAEASYSELERGEKSNLREEVVIVSKDPISILLMGIEDYSSEGVGRTDSLIVATLNPKDQTMKLLSIPRDTQVEIPGRIKLDKINHAYAFGGKELTINSVENLLDIPIDYYATVSFKGFKDIVDEIGGVTVDVPFNFWEKSDINNKRIDFTEGEMSLDGEESLAYARMRKQDPRGDFGRNDRQKQIITASIEKILTPNNLLKLDNIATHIGENVETNLKVTDALAMQKNYSNFNSAKIESISIKGEDIYLNDIYYFQPDEGSLTELKVMLKDHLDPNAASAKENELTVGDDIK